MANLVLYDGVCGLCNRLNHFILRRDAANQFLFASLQGARARELLHRYGRNPDDMNTVYVIADYGAQGERILWKGRAILHVFRSLGGVWRVARLFELLPVALVDRIYGFVARHRYRWFGRSETCAVPLAQWRGKFLDDDADAKA